jgi:hypothetical protein
LDHSVADLKLTKPTIVEGDMWGLVVLLIDGSTEWRGREKSMALNISSSQPTDWRPKEKAPAINRCSSQPAERRLVLTLHLQLKSVETAVVCYFRFLP